MNCNLKEFKEFIDNEMLLILGQMDKPMQTSTATMENSVEIP